MTGFLASDWLEFSLTGHNLTGLLEPVGILLLLLTCISKRDNLGSWLCISCIIDILLFKCLPPLAVDPPVISPESELADLFTQFLRVNNPILLN